jgi:hypothetical protein
MVDRFAAQLLVKGGLKMAKSAGGGGPDEPDGLPQHPYVERLKPDPSQPAKRVVELVGLPGNSDRAGYQRLYLTTRLDYYAEFLTSDIVHSATEPADQSTFPGHEATRVSIDRDATIHYIWARSPQPVDEFDLDIRLGARRAAPAALPPPTHAPVCISPVNGCTDTCLHTVCIGHTCDTCAHTQCAQNTCAGHGTCVNTQCVQPACVFTQGGQNTCANTQCNQATCVTCPAAATCPQTCVG